MYYYWKEQWKNTSQATSRRISYTLVTDRDAYPRPRHPFGLLFLADGDLLRTTAPRECVKAR